MTISTIDQTGLNNPITLTSPVISTITNGSATLTLPANTGTLLSTANPQSGGVIQVVTGTTATTTSTTSKTFVATTLSASITPKFSTSKILVIMSCPNISNGGTSNGVGVALARGGSIIFNPSSIDNTNQYYTLYAGAATSVPITLSYLDSPASTSSLTYSIQVASYSGTNSSFISQGSQSPGTATITLLEVAA